MLEEYESFNHTGMQIEDISKHIYDYTSGYPFLVSTICKTIDIKLSNEPNFEKWSRFGVNKAVDMILKSNISFLTDIILKIDENPDLKQILKSIIIEGQTFWYDIYNNTIDKGIMLGLIKMENGFISIANRITQMHLSYSFISEEKVKLFHITETSDRSMYLKSGKLDMECILNGFIEHFRNYYKNNKNEFNEEYGRFLFMVFLKPIINDIDHFYMESQINDGKRTDLIIDFYEDQYLIEFKTFHEQFYIDKWITQLVDHLYDRNLNTGYLIIYSFNQSNEACIKKMN